MDVSHHKTRRRGSDARRLAGWEGRRLPWCGHSSAGNIQGSDQHSLTGVGHNPSRTKPPSSTLYCLKSVDVRKLQVAILARSPREMSQTNRILSRYILSRVRVSVRPRIFFTRKNPKPDSPACCLFQVVYGSALRPDKQLNWKLQNRPSWVASR